MNADKDEIQESIDKIYDVLSEFEKIVLTEYLFNKSFKDIHKAVTKKIGRKIQMHTIDDALLRIKAKSKKIEIDEDIGKTT